MKPREWWVETESVEDNRAFEIVDEKVFIEFQGRKISKPVHVIEKSAYLEFYNRYDAERVTVKLLAEKVDKLEMERDLWKNAFGRLYSKTQTALFGG